MPQRRRSLSALINRNFIGDRRFEFRPLFVYERKLERKRHVYFIDSGKTLLAKLASGE